MVKPGLIDMFIAIHYCAIVCTVTTIHWTFTTYLQELQFSLVIQSLYLTLTENPPVLTSVQYIQTPGKKYFIQDPSTIVIGEGSIGKSFIPEHPLCQQSIYACIGLKVHVTSDYHRPVCGNSRPARSSFTQ